MEDVVEEIIESSDTWVHRLGKNKKALTVLSVTAVIFTVGLVYFKVRAKIKYQPKDPKKVKDVINIISHDEDLVREEGLRVTPETTGVVQTPDGTEEFLIGLEGGVWSTTQHNVSLVERTSAKLRRVIKRAILVALREEE